MYHNRSYLPISDLSFSPPSSSYKVIILLSYWKETNDGVMFLFHATTTLSFLLLFIYFSSFLLIKIFTYLYDDHSEILIFQRDIVFSTTHDDEHKCYEEDLIADVLGGESLHFLHKGSDFDDCLLFEQSEEDSKEAVFSEEDDDTLLVLESAHEYSPVENLSDHEKMEIECNDVVVPTNVLTDSKDVPFEAANEDNEEDKVVQINTEKLQIELQENYGGSLTGDSTSKSSVEWRSSAIFRDSETEYSSSSRKSSSRWESYTLFRKYDEEMLFFDTITAQKLSETESLRSIKFHPRSISERIVHRLSTTKPITSHTLMGKRRDPYQELESAYVAQICLTWEALNWNYTNYFRQKKYSQLLLDKKKKSSDDEGCAGCPARIAQQFQQFQVLLQRFIENEPYEYGRRPEIYARRRISSPKLLQVPEFRDSEGEEGNEEDTNISSFEFVVILEESIHTFMSFLKADKEKCSDKVRAFMKRKTISADPIFHHFLKRSNKKKKLRINDIGGIRRRCIIRKRKMKHEEEMEILMAMIDLKVVSRVLRMSEINKEQLHWCEEKMSRVRVSEGKMQRDYSSPLFFPSTLTRMCSL